MSELYNESSEHIKDRLATNSVHAVITDPPYGMEALGEKWDKVLPPQEIWNQCFEVLRPGGFCLAFGHTRLYHRLACQLEDAGFKIHDCLCWAYATGTPRPLNFDRAIDRIAGYTIEHEPDEAYEPQTEDGKTWQGWANLLKTAWEPIVLAQKPIEGTYVENVLKWQVGGLNIDECRMPYKDEADKQSVGGFDDFAGTDHGEARYFSANTGGKKQCNVHPMGRWPANLVYLDPMFVQYDHIFMIPKPSKAEKGGNNPHPTVKPLRIMERLIRLVTPKPSVVNTPVIVLDPFMGSGTTGVSAKRLGRSFVGFELSKEFYDIAVNRVRRRVIVDIGAR